MRSTSNISEHIRELMLAHPKKKIQASITVDPIVIDGILLEADMIPVYRQMNGYHPRPSRYAKASQRSMFRASDLVNTDSTNAEEAKRLVANAFSTRDAVERKRLAESALELFPAGVEAYIVLARLETDSKLAIKLLERGLDVATAFIDKSWFEEPDDYFWQEIETRPYMRCRTALAVELWESGNKQLAIEHLKKLLQLNPADNQGLRFHILSWMLEHNPNDPYLDEKMNDYGERDNSALTKFAYVLYQFIKHGNDKLTRHSLSKAVESNKFIPAILCGKASPPASLELTRVVRGTPLEAVAYNHIGASAWRKIEGALDWLAVSCSPSLLSSKTIMRKIATVENFKREGLWAEPIPVSSFP